jgi:two-component system sensor histidine kinase HydH
MSSRSAISGDLATQGESTLIRPLKVSSMLASIYSLVGGIYIVLSSYFASQFSVSTSELYYIEVLKGCGYVILTGILLFVFAFWSLHRLRIKEREIEQQQRVLLASEKRAAAGLFASSVAHDINNILGVNQMAISRLRAQTLPEETASYLDKLELVQSKLSVLAHELSLATGKQFSNGRENIDLSQTINQALSLVRLHDKVKYCKLETFIPSILPFDGDASLLQRMVLNLVINAADATDNRGRIRINVQEQKPRIIIEVHDDGTGIPKELRTRILEPFFSTKKDGSGLGLLSVKLCTDVHQGQVEVGDSELGGACFRITLPKIEDR